MEESNKIMDMDVEENLDGGIDSLENFGILSIHKHFCIHDGAWRQSFFESQHRDFHRDLQVSWNAILKNKHQIKKVSTIQRFASLEHLEQYKNYFLENTEFENKYNEWIKRDTVCALDWIIIDEYFHDKRFYHFINNGTDVIWMGVFHVSDHDALKGYFKNMYSHGTCFNVRHAVLGYSQQNDNKMIIIFRIPKTLYKEFSIEVFQELGVISKLNASIDDISVWDCEWENIENPIENIDIYEQVHFST